MQFPGSIFDRPAVRPALGCCLSILLLAVGKNGCADDGWPFVRGPAYNGHSSETDLADEWPAEGPPVLWTRKLGQGYSAFVATGDRVFTQGQNVTGQYVYCLQADTGETVWEYRYDWPYEAAGVYPGPRSTPTLSNGRLFFTSPDGLLCCLDQSSGDRIWSKDLLKTYGIEGCDFGYACSPTVTDNMVILPVGGVNAGVVAFASETGAEVWTSTSEPASYTPAYPIEVNGAALIVCYMQNSLLILHRHDGQLIHQMDLSHGYDEHSAWPIYDEPNLWISGPFRSGSQLVDVSVEEPQTVWRSMTMSNDVCSSALVDDHLYGFDIFDVQSKTHRPSRGIFRCVDFHTGEEKWSNGTGRPRRTSNAEEFASDIGQAGIIAADGKLIILNELGELILLKTDPQQTDERISGALSAAQRAPYLVHQLLFYARQSRAGELSSTATNRNRHRERRRRSFLRVIVSGNGPGMDETVRQRIFDPFVTTKAGTGRGWSTMKRWSSLSCALIHHQFVS